MFMSPYYWFQPNQTWLQIFNSTFYLRVRGTKTNIIRAKQLKFVQNAQTRFVQSLNNGKLKNKVKKTSCLINYLMLSNKMRKISSLFNKMYRKNLIKMMKTMIMTMMKMKITMNTEMKTWMMMMMNNQWKCKWMLNQKAAPIQKTLD